MLADHLTGQRDYSLQIWSVLVFEGRYRLYIAMVHGALPAQRAQVADGLRKRRLPADDVDPAPDRRQKALRPSAQGIAETRHAESAIERDQARCGAPVDDGQPSRWNRSVSVFTVK